ncbi:alpha-beta hydrolase superfamily lysophospholipase [Trueperella bonasi]|uniref:Alpha-beta hydrolase superfamily lysophospholipase n=1 Tax=Trueperella bonasi TaxID=312286 RepID=A0ABT9NFV7_9ACTO|nr:hypothetical protein [Trueperella bonasi]MDP9806082.1 alpha-beta hydrolase superfamily lysophospholipase [Trueperella bonasi]
MTAKKIFALTMGAALTLTLAVRYPHLVRSVYASAPAVNPPKAALQFQKLVMTILPACLTVPKGLTKIQLLPLVDGASHTWNTDQPALVARSVKEH